MSRRLPALLLTSAFLLIPGLAAAGAPVLDERPGAATVLEALPRLFGHRDPATLFPKVTEAEEQRAVARAKQRGKPRLQAGEVAGVQ